MMVRSLKTISLLLLIGVSMKGYSQKNSFDIQANFLPVVFRNYSLYGGYNTSSRTSVGLTVGFQDAYKIPDFMWESSQADYFTSYYVVPEFRWYFRPTEMGNDRWFVTGYGKFRSATIDAITRQTDSLNYSLHENGFAVGSTMGYVWRVNSTFTVSAWLGLSYYFTGTTFIHDDSGSSWSSVDIYQFSRVQPRAGLSLGLRL